MKKAIMGGVAVVAMVFALSFPAAAPAAPTPAAAHAAAEHHPEIQDAINALRNARFHLNHAAHDFGGHRVDAIKAIDNAITQLRVCMQYDKD